MKRDSQTDLSAGVSSGGVDTDGYENARDGYDNAGDGDDKAGDGYDSP